jgi:hypothetical protein
LPRINSISPRRNGRSLRVKLKEVEPHSEDHILSKEDNIQNRAEDMLTTTLFLVP